MSDSEKQASLLISPPAAASSREKEIIMCLGCGSEEHDAEVVCHYPGWGTIEVRCPDLGVVVVDCPCDGCTEKDNA